MEARDKVVKWFKKASIKVEDSDIWSKKNLPLSVRSVRSVLFDAKAYLTKWGFQNFGLWADFDKGTLEYQKKPVLSVFVENGELKITCDPKWDQHFQHVEWTESVGVIRAKLVRGMIKRDGKGKDAGKAAPL